MNLHADTAINHNLLAFSDFVDGIVDKILSSGINPTDFREDVKEFKEVYEYATETSTFGGSFLGFN
jgi:tagatose-1,6-bisphosphate aldolase non-catalytic subunit AgaZ/GatZ